MQYILIGLKIGYDKPIANFKVIGLTHTSPDVERYETDQYDEVICVVIPDDHNLDLHAVQLMRMVSYQEPRTRRRLERE